MGTSQVLKWWKKISWDEKDPSTGLPKRVTKNRGQYVRYADDDGPRYGRLDNILTHDAIFGMISNLHSETVLIVATGLGRIRAFLIISPVRTLDDPVDSLTGLHMYEHEEPTVIGLTKLSAEVVYMVPFKKESNGDMWDFTSGTDTMDHQDCILLHVDWHIGFM
ncbi:hypothetical protein F4804DRAFT_339596 [Jackrogersella minutella]|nr:hypothetical protein F4804DRAFT_339596 [Jackrogersella minutella]